MLFTKDLSKDDIVEFIELCILEKKSSGFGKDELKIMISDVFFIESQKSHSRNPFKKNGSVKEMTF